MLTLSYGIMKVAVALTGNRVSGPGEALEIVVYDAGEEHVLLEKFQNPAATATSARGIVMLQSVVSRGIEKLIISGIGAHAMQYATGRIELLNGGGMTLETALQNFVEGNLEKIDSATHLGHNHGSHA